jgi:uncharacterized protein (DUF362 family)
MDLPRDAPYECMMVTAMDRREFLQLVSASPLLATETQASLPAYHVVTPFSPKPETGMPGAYRGKVARVHAERSIDAKTEAVDADTVRHMLSAGMRGLTGDKSDRDAWARFVTPGDVVGIKVNSSGAPHIMSTPELVAGIVDNVVAAGVPPENIWIYERMGDQMRMIHHDRFVPQKVHIHAAEGSRGSMLGYDPKVYVEVNFFGEDDTRSNIVRLVSEKLTKIINVPNMKEHQASGVTGCLKNISYGNFSNVARSHRHQKTNTYSFIGTLASVEPVRSRTVLNIMDGLRGVWHAGPFSLDKRFRFYPKQILFGTDPVAVDRLLIDVIEAKRRAEHAPSIFDRSPEHLQSAYSRDPMKNAFLREPGHVQYAGGLGLGEYDIERIKVEAVEL